VPFNSAFLVQPSADDSVLVDAYYKNRLLLFGETLPWGDFFPRLYELFPQVTHFQPGSRQNAFTIRGQRLGVSICYEAVLPSYIRQVAAGGVQGIINLTNDSWFGPTNEPMFHARLTVFRAVEHRIPLLRVANSGLSYFVDEKGNMSGTTRAFAPAIVQGAIVLPAVPHATFYARFGEWFVVVCLVLLLYLLLCSQKRDSSRVSSSKDAL
jgi:apolipoprotein N-acyltransferase